MADVIELEVAATPTVGAYLVRVMRPVSGQGGASTATMHLDAKAYDDSRDELETAVLASAVTGRRVLSPSERRLRTVGQQLFDALFTGPVGEVYRASAASAGSRGEQIQIVLRLETPELAALPWESMYDAQNDEYICLTDPLIRHIPSADVEPLAIVAPLRVLAIVASPDGLAPLDVEAERRKLSDALAEPIAAGRIHLAWLMQATWEQVQDEMLTGTWHVLHFIGHGDYDPESDQGVMVLTGDGGGVHLVEADRLAGLLDEARPTPRLVVLNSCQSGRSGTHDLFSSTAAALVRRGINAVAAMQFSISDAGAAKFTRGLYSALASGRSIGDAVGSGRVGLLSTPGSLEWVTPVLYVRGNADRLFTITAAPAGPRWTRPHRRVVTVIGGTAAAVLAGAVVLLALLGSPSQVPPTTVAGDPASVIRDLDEAGVDDTLPGGEAELGGYLANSEFTPYPAVAEGLLRLIGDQRLRRPVAIDAIVFDYQVLAGAPPPNQADLVDVGLLRDAVVGEFASRYGGPAADFASLLVPRS